MAADGPRLRLTVIGLKLEIMPMRRTTTVQRIPPSEGPYMGLHIKGDVGNSETDDILRMIEAHFARHGPIRLLVAYDAEPGLISAEDLYDNMRFAKLAGDKLDRMAVVGKRAWEETWVALFGLFGGVRTQFFRRDHIREALDWLNAQ